MNLQYLLTQIVLSSAGGIVTVIVSWYFLKEDIQKMISRKPAEEPREESNQLLTLRLQAHERMIVFIDRLNPSNLFLRLYEQGITARELHAHILNEIRSEYQHNVSQQLYLNAANWNVISKLKEDTIAMINTAIGGLPAGASGAELGKKVLEHMAGITENPYDLTIELIKQDIHQLF